MRDGRVKQTSGWVDLPGDYLNLLTFSAITPTLLRLGLASLLDRSGSNSETPVLHRPQKKCHFADFLHKSTTGSTSTCVFFLYDNPSLCHYFSYTFDPKMHHPAMDS